jgi:hypothetical protein
MKPVFWKVLFALLLTAALYSCNCGSITCPGLDTGFSRWLPYKDGETITFTNGSGNEIRFVVSRSELSVSKNLDCGKDGLGGCNCPDCPEPTGESAAISSDTSRKKGKLVYNSVGVGIRQHKTNKDSVFLTYTIFDHGNSLVIHPTLQYKNTDSLLSTYTVGNHTYTNVVVHQTDTNARSNPNPIYNKTFVWKSYYNQEYGVIAFYDLATQSFFYRKR